MTKLCACRMCRDRRRAPFERWRWLIDPTLPFVVGLWVAFLLYLGWWWLVAFVAAVFGARAFVLAYREERWRWLMLFD